jgi:hypothetical protein
LQRRRKECLLAAIAEADQMGHHESEFVEQAEQDSGVVQVVGRCIVPWLGLGPA